jgi:hypothetical protein
MVRRERTRSGRARRLEALLEGGDHRAAAAEARRVLADAESGDEGHRAARQVLASLRPEPGAVGAGLGGVLLALAVTLWTVLGSAR